MTEKVERVQYCLVFNENVMYIEGPAWSAYNVLINEAHIKTTYCTLPVLESSPTDWSYLYTFLKLAQKLNTLIPPAEKTIVSLDL